VPSAANAVRLSPRISRACRVLAATSIPASGIVMNATKAAYLWMPPDSDSGTPGRSVGNTATSRMQAAHNPTSPATRRSPPPRATATASRAAPSVRAASETGSSHPWSVWK
jgi:hypothetical protein